MKNVACKVIGRWIVIAISEAQPSEEDEREILAVFKGSDLARVRVLSFTQGGAPTAKLRRQLYEVIQGKEIPTAVVTDVSSVQRIITAMSWYNKLTKGFPTSAMEEAFRYVEIPPYQYDEFRREAMKLQAEVAVRAARRRP